MKHTIHLYIRVIQIPIYSNTTSTTFYVLEHVIKRKKGKRKGLEYVYLNRIQPVLQLSCFNSYTEQLVCFH